MKTLHVSRIKLHDVAGIENLEIEPGRVTVISGRNDTGKSSVIKALRALFKGGTDATLLKKGSHEGEIVLVLDNGTEIQTRLHVGKQSTRVKHYELGTIGAPQKYVSSLSDSLGMNPIDLITSRPDRRAAFLLEALPMTVTEEQIREAAGDLVDTIPDVESNHALTVISSISKTLFDKRQDINRDAKHARTTANQLADSLPEKTFSVSELRKQKERAEAEKNSSQAKANRAMIKSNVQEGKDVDEAKNERDYKLLTARDAYTEVVQRIRLTGEKRRIKMAEDLAPETEAQTSAIAVLDSKIESAAAEANTKKVITSQKREATVNEKRSKKYTAAIKAIEELGNKLSSDLPFDIEIGADGDIYMDGLSFSSVNTQRQVELAMQIAALRSGRLGLILVDGLELLDAEHFEAIKTWALDQDEFQLIVTRVTDGEFSVDTFNKTIIETN